MFSATAIGLIVAVSSGTWVYTWTMRRTGNNTKSSTITALVAAAMAGIFTWTLIATIDSLLGN